MVIILFGVAGAGKTTVGRLLSAELGWTFYDADLFHFPRDIEKMERGIPLSDEDRRPWLLRLRNTIEKWLERGENVVLACSALKEIYRRSLWVNDSVHFVYLKGAHSLIAERLQARSGHFMNRALLDSQFEALQEPAEGTLKIDVQAAPGKIVEAIRQALNV